MPLMIALWALLAQQSPPTALDIYARDFHGEFAPKGACARSAERWRFQARELVEGSIWCEVGDVTETGGTTVLTTRGCSREAEALPPRTYQLDLLSADVVKARVGETTTLLQRCPRSN